MFPRVRFDPGTYLQSEEDEAARSLSKTPTGRLFLYMAEEINRLKGSNAVLPELDILVAHVTREYPPTLNAEPHRNGPADKYQSIKQLERSSLGRGILYLATEINRLSSRVDFPKLNRLVNDANNYQMIQHSHERKTKKWGRPKKRDDVYFNDLSPSAALEKLDKLTEHNHSFANLAQAHMSLIHLSNLASLSFQRPLTQEAYMAIYFQRTLLKIIPKEYSVLASVEMERYATLKGTDLEPHEILRSLNKMRGCIDEAMCSRAMENRRNGKKKTRGYK